MLARGIIWSGTASKIHLGMVEQFTRIRVLAKPNRPVLEAVSELKAALAAFKIKLDRLELQSHGLPAKIVLGNDSITHANVARVGAALREVMAPNGLIEVLACSVADGPVRTPLLYFKNVDTTINAFADYLPIDSEFIPLMKTPAFARDYKSAIDAGQFEIEEGNPLATGVSIPGYYDYFEKDRKALLQAIGSKWPKLRKLLEPTTLVPTDSGAAFCRAFAIATHCRVRAAAEIQHEENCRNIQGLLTQVGNWEGKVWDFLPNGTCKYLGENLARGVFH